MIRGRVMKVTQAYRFALDPSPAQERMLRSHAGAARFAWNWALGRCEQRYEAERKWYSGAELHKLWNAEKKADPGLAWWAENSKCAYQEAFRDLDRALRDFVRSKKAGGRAGGSGSRSSRSAGNPVPRPGAGRAGSAAREPRSRCPASGPSAPTRTRASSRPSWKTA